MEQPIDHRCALLSHPAFRLRPGATFGLEFEAEEKIVIAQELDSARLGRSSIEDREAVRTRTLAAWPRTEEALEESMDPQTDGNTVSAANSSRSSPIATKADLESEKQSSGDELHAERHAVSTQLTELTRSRRNAPSGIARIGRRSGPCLS